MISDPDWADAARGSPISPGSSRTSVHCNCHQAVKLVSKDGIVKERKVVRYTLNGPDDLDKILVRFLAPRDVENTTLLTWEAKDGNDDQWLYLLATKKPKRIAASGKKNRFMGTDFTYEDLRPEDLAVNRYALVGRESVDGQECFVIEATPATERQAADTAYSKRRIWVRSDSYAVSKREYYDRHGRLEKVETFRKLANVKGSAWRAPASSRCTAGRVSPGDLPARTTKVFLGCFPGVFCGVPRIAGRLELACSRTGRPSGHPGRS
jgi:hypothetical protein